MEWYILVPLIPLLPLLGFLLNTLVIRDERQAGLIASAAVGLAFVLALAATILLQLQPPAGVEPPRVDWLLWEWIRIGEFRVPFGLLFDPLTAVMTLLVTGVGTLIHIYSIGYMHHDPRAVRYFAYLNLFIVSMLFLVMGNNLLLMFLGWEGVGLCSFLLIGFWFERKTASDAAVKAFVVNRIGDAAFLLAMMAVFNYFDTLNFYSIRLPDGSILEGWLERVGELTLLPPLSLGLFGQIALPGAIAGLLLIAVTGKSAQIPLFVWLPDAMAGPTPVSALIHAATMVTAGVYLMARTNSLFEIAPGAQSWVLAIGTITAIVAATAAVTQWDIKRVLAYSTVSQLGFMVAACGLGAYVAALFHLLTHGLFKALLFLGSGSVIHGTHETQDMRKMGGLREHMPATFRTYLIGALALAGIIPFAGFWSKDEIIAAAVFGQAGRNLGWGVLLVITSLLTAFYMGRQIALVFFGKQRDNSYHAHESGQVMTTPLWILAGGAVLGGLINLPLFISEEASYPGAHLLESFLEPVLHSGELAVLTWSKLLFALLVTGLGAAAGYAGFRFYADRSDKIKAGARDPLYRALGDIWTGAEMAWGFDWLYQRAVVRPFKWLGGLLSSFDLHGIDGLVNGVGRAAGALAGGLRRAQTGYVRNYALLFLLGVVIIVGYFTLNR